MANFTALKTAIQNAIKQNGNEEITGDVLQQILLSIVSTMGDGSINTIEQNLSQETLARQNGDNTLQSNINAEALARGNADTQLQNAINAIKANIDNGYVYAGIATPSSTPVSGKVFYVATAAGTYTNFGGQVLTQGINILRYNGSAWSSQQLIGIDDAPTVGSNSLVKSGGVQNELALGAVYDVSAKNPTGGPNSDGKWESLSALLSDANLNTLIPTAYRKGGMSIKFVQSSDNNYIQARLMAQNFTTDVTQWQGVDDEPAAGSDNLVKSGGVYEKLNDLSADINGSPNYTEGYYLDSYDDAVADASFCYSDYVAVDAAVQTEGISWYYGTYSAYARLILYDENKTQIDFKGQISGASARLLTAEQLGSAKYFRASFTKDYADAKVLDVASATAMWSPSIADGIKDRLDDIETTLSNKKSEAIEGSTDLITSGGVANYVKFENTSYIEVELTKQTNKEFYYTNLEVQSANNLECAIVDVVEGEEYLISGYNENSNYCLATVYNSQTNTKERLLNIGSLTGGTDIPAQIPSGYDKLAINGFVNLYPVNLKKKTTTQSTIKQLIDNLDDEKAPKKIHIAITEQTNGKIYSITRRFNNTKDVVWKFGNKASNANNNFDFKELGFVNRGDAMVSDKYLAADGYEYLLGHNTDYIVALQVGANSNKNGDFSENTSLFTGGAHGYNNVMDTSSTATQREISNKIFVEGKEITEGDLYCDDCRIEVINRIQGCNTEKEDGTGREIVEQKIILDIDSHKVCMTIYLTALEEITFYGVGGIAQYFDFDKVRFIGSHSRLGIYDKGDIVKVDNNDKGTNIIRNYGDDYAFDIGIDKTFGICDSFYNANTPNALMTTAKKGYYDLIVSSAPLVLNVHEQIAFRGFFDFIEINP